MIEIVNRQIRIDGEPRLILAGEVHYFRSPREQWAELIDLAKEAGCTAIASYIPWIVHELPDGSIDVTGTSAPHRDVAAFIDLCAEKGLWFIARPGPFIMAELKNEGIPYRVYREHPEIIPVGWDARPTPTANVDYLAPAFLAENRRWYEAIMPLLAERLHDNGGPVIAVQLDNEIGMLAWVTNTPDLTEGLVADFGEWLRSNELADRYPGLELTDAETLVAGVRSPQEAWAGALRVDLARFMRGRFARYVQKLRQDAEDLGVKGVPFIINIHGTEGGGGEPFPIGISQLMETYSGVPGMLSGSDHYVGDVTLNTGTDLYVMNALQAAVHDEHQPITSVEFEAGTGDYAGGMDQEYDPHTTELKTRLFLMQGNRLINYYLLAGGHNPHLDEPTNDGDNRIAITGERHGFAAPIGPEGTPSNTWPYTVEAGRVMKAAEPWLAAANEEVDNLSLGFIPDSFATEYVYPNSETMKRVADDLRSHRGAGQRRFLARSALLQGYRFDAVDLAHHAPRAVDGRPVVLMVATAAHMDPVVQQRIVDHLAAGGSFFGFGPLPSLDLEDRPCTVLADYLGVRGGEVVREGKGYRPSAVRAGMLAKGEVKDTAEVRVGWLQPLEADGAEVLLTSVEGAPCGLALTAGAGRAVLLAADIPSNLFVMRTVLEHLGVRHSLVVDSDVPGIFATTTRDEAGNRLLHLLNVTGYEPAVGLTLDGELLGGARLVLRAYGGWMLPLGITVPQGRVLWANAELATCTDDELHFDRPALVDGRPGVEVLLETSRPIQAADGVEVTTDERGTWVRGAAPLVVGFA